MLDFHNKVFVCTANKKDGDITPETTFYFKQNGKIVKAIYNGRNIVYGELIGMIDDQGILQATFNHLNANSLFSGGSCTFTIKNRTLHGSWTVAEANSLENELVLEELSGLF